jgi:hypothetical protein
VSKDFDEKSPKVRTTPTKKTESFFVRENLRASARYVTLDDEEALLRSLPNVYYLCWILMSMKMSVSSPADAERTLEPAVFSSGLNRIKTVFDRASIDRLHGILFAGKIPNIVERAERIVPGGIAGYDLAVGYDAVNEFFYIAVRSQEVGGEVRINVDPQDMRAWVFLNAGGYARMLHVDSGMSAGEPCPQEYETFVHGAMTALATLSDEHSLRAEASPALNGLVDHKKAQVRSLSGI